MRQSLLKIGLVFFAKISVFPLTTRHCEFKFLAFEAEKQGTLTA
jgi:hypothetical protein